MFSRLSIVPNFPFSAKMASSSKKKQEKFSSEDRKIQQQSVDLSSGSVFTSDGQRRIARVSVMKRREINICNDVWDEVFKFSTRAELGLKLALLGRRFDGLAGGQLGSTRRQWTLGIIALRRAGNCAKICKNRQKKNGVLLEKSALLDVLPPSNLVGFNQILINHVDQNVIAFLQRTCHLFNNVDITFKVPSLTTKQSRRFLRKRLWPLIAKSVYKLINFGGLRILFSPSILRDCANLRVINADYDFPKTPAGDRAGASNGQALNKWLHTPRRDGLPKVVTCKKPTNLVSRLDGLKVAFVRAELPVSYLIYVMPPDWVYPEPFELENQRTRERMTFQRFGEPPKNIWLLKRGLTNWWDENKWAEIERKEEASFGHWPDDKNLIYCYENMTFGLSYV